MFKERLYEVWTYIRAMLIFAIIVVVGAGLGIGILKILEVTILGEKGVEYLLLGILFTFVGGILLLALLGALLELKQHLTHFITWLFIEPYKARKLEMKEELDK